MAKVRVSLIQHDVDRAAPGVAAASSPRPEGAGPFGGLLAALSAALVAAVVGFGGTIALVVEAGHAVGASEPEIASWVTAVCLGTGIASAGLSLAYRMPVVAAWSTPGAALIAASANGIGYAGAVGCFLVAGLLAVLVGLWRPLGDLVARIPRAVASAMLAGILLPFGLGVFVQARDEPVAVALLLGTYLLARSLVPTAALLLVLIAGFGLIAARGYLHLDGLALWPPTLVAVAPEFEPARLVGLALPLFLVTMVGQNLPGLAVMQAAGYAPPARAAITTTGALSALLAPFGAHGVNLAAITAALCTGPEAHPDPARRWIAGLFYGITYGAIALFATPLVALFAMVPRPILAVIAGLALIGALGGALSAALAAEAEAKEAALLTFLATASGLTLAGVGAAFWGLLLGLAVLGIRRIFAPRR